MVPPPQAKPDVFLRCFPYFKSWTEHISFRPKATAAAIVASYQGGKATLYRNAMESLKEAPLSQKDAYVKSFVKAEKINITAKGDPAPRVIQPFNTRYCLELGRYLKLRECAMLGWCNKVWGGSSVTVFKGLNVEQAGEHMWRKWSDYKDPVAVGLDASRWDQHVGIQALNFEFGFYKAVYPNDHYLNWLLSMQLHNKGVLLAKDGSIRYKVNGRRMSGVPNTGLGNCILMTALVHTYCRERGVKASLANNGDDCVVIMERQDLATFQAGLTAWFLDFGINMVVEPPVDTFEAIEFCQCHPIHTATGPRMVRTLHTSMAKDTYSVVSMRNAKDCETWLSAVGMCGETINAGVPVLEEFARAFTRAGHNRSVSKLHVERILGYGGVERIKGMTKRVVPITTEARVSFYRAFGVVPYQQEVMEELLRRVIITSPGAPEVTYQHPTPAYPLNLINNPSQCLPNLSPTRK
nr:RNA polymerase [Flumine tombus-like virus 26]